MDNTYCYGHSRVSSSLAAHLAVRLPLPVALHHDFWPSDIAAAVDEHTIETFSITFFMRNGKRQTAKCHVTSALRSRLQFAVHV